MKIQKETKEKMLFFGLIIFILINVLFDIYGIAFINIPLSNNEFHDLVTTLYSIQASISTLGIALLALLSESIKEKRYGMRVGHFLMVNHYKFLTHQSIIIFSMIILFLNYLFLAFNWLNSSVSLFIVSLILIIFLTNDILKLFINKSLVYEEMEDYIINRFIKGSKKDQENNLNNINDHLVQLSYEHKILEIKENLSIYYKIYRKGRDIGKKLIEEHYVDLYKRISYYGSRDTNEVLHLSLVEMYEIANRKSHYIDFINPLLLQIYEVLSSLPQKYYYREYDFPYITLYKVIRQIDGLDVEKRSQSLTYAKGIYPLVFEKIEWEKSFGIARMSGFYTYLEAKFKDIDDIDYDVLNIFTKHLIDHKETEVLSRGFFNQMKMQSTRNNNMKNMHFLNMLVYLYYILYENVMSDKMMELKSYVKNLPNEIRETIDEYLAQLKIERIDLQKIIPKISAQISEWEVFPENMTGISTKIMIGDKVVRTFFFYLFVSKSWNSDELSNYIEQSGLDTERMYSYVKDTSDEFCWWYKIFKDHFMPSTLNDIGEALEVAEESLNSLIVDNKLEEAEVIDAKGTYEDAKKITKHIEKDINKKFNNSSDKETQYNKENCTQLSFSTTASLNILDNQEFIKDYLRKNMELLIISDFLEHLKDNVKKITVFCRDNNKLELLFDEINKRPNTYNTMIGSNNLPQFYNDPLREEYQNLLNNIHVINLGIKPLEIIFLNSKEIGIQVKNLKVHFEKLSEKEILNQVETNENSYKFDDSDDGKEYLFEKDELLNLFENKYRKVTWEFDVVYKYKSNSTVLQYTILQE